MHVGLSTADMSSHTSVKRKHEEMEKSDSDEYEHEDEDEAEAEESEENESSGSEYQDDQNKKGKGKAKVGSRTRAPSDPFVANDTEDAKRASLRLRAKSAVKSKKSPMEGHAASYKPIGSSSPKRPGQATAMGPPPPVPTNNPVGAPLM